MLDTPSDNLPRFITKNLGRSSWYKPTEKILFKTSMLRLCDINDAHIVVKGDITLTKNSGRSFSDIRDRLLAFKTTHCLPITYQRSIIC